MDGAVKQGPLVGILFDCSTIVLSTVALSVNVSTVYRMVSRNRANHQQYDMLMVLMFYHFVFNLCAASSSFFRSLYVQEEVAAWSHYVTLATSVAITCGNICLLIDRLLALDKPVDYCARTKLSCLVLSLAFMFTVFVTTFAVYVAADYDVDSRNVPDIVYIFQCGSCAVTIGITVVLVWKLRLFLKKSSRHAANNVNVITASKIVLYQICAEIGIIIIPTVITTIISGYLGYLMAANYGGKCRISLFALYTAVCAVLLAAKLNRNNVGVLFTKSTAF